MFFVSIPTIKYYYYLRYLIVHMPTVGPSAFNRWMYHLTLQNNSNATTDTEYQYSDLLPNTVYTIGIFPSAPGAVGNVDDALMSSWIVQTVDNGQYMSIRNETILQTHAQSSREIVTIILNPALFACII